MDSEICTKQKLEHPHSMKRLDGDASDYILSFPVIMIENVLGKLYSKTLSGSCWSVRAVMICAVLETLVDLLPFGSSGKLPLDL